MGRASITVESWRCFEGAVDACLPQNGDGCDQRVFRDGHGVLVADGSTASQSGAALLRRDPTPADNGNDVLTMTPEEALKRRQRRWRVTLAALIVVLASLAAWVVEQITRVN
jgi:hypothetical protein